MIKPPMRVVVTAGCFTVVAAIVVGVSTQPAPGRAATNLAADRVAAPASAPSRPSPTTSARVFAPAPATSSASTASTGSAAGPPTPASSAGPSSTPSTASTFILPPAPALHPAAQDAAAVAAAAANAASNVAHTSTPRRTSTGSSSGSSAGTAPAPSGSSYPERADIANAIYSEINSERAANGLPGLGRSGQLNSSAHAHNVAMANTGQFAHQVTGEAGLGARISATGYNWNWAGENIAWGSSASVAFGLSLETQMYNEVPPDDGHRLNILSTSAHNVGVDVITDGSGKMWITCDFGS